MTPDPLTCPVRFSHLKHMAKSPAHCRHAMTTRFDSDLYARGRTVHTLVLGVGELPEVWTGKTRQGKAWEAWKAEREGHTIITQAAWDQARAMADAVMAEPTAAEYLIGWKEQHIIWRNMGQECSSTIDIWNPGYRLIVDLKTGKSSHPDSFPHSGSRMAYQAQLAWYLDAAAFDIRNAPGYEPPTRAANIVVETTPPHVVTVFELTPAMIEQGRIMCRAWLEKLVVCRASNQWPGYSQSVVKWDVSADDIDLDFTGVEETDEQA